MECKQSVEQQKLDAVYKELSQYQHKAASHAGLSDSAFDIFYVLMQLEEGCSQKTIAQLSWQSKQTVNSTIKILEKKGYLKIEKGKGKECSIYLLEPGTAVIREKIAPLVEHERRMLEKMGLENARALIELTTQYVKLLKTIEEEEQHAN
ncbi:MarR family winged helix-turn-helix transcriptional regulator [uncultured Dubosiella sp.]|jgi:DNA-binding MarR family transcriptional regulator|uniref:MarR family winged helix-turn-helix transcriptional regulator n=1 Tax=uncultured Dubosiella sp. TaxID=1937011 RepID=UPI00208CC959|nr:MarR family transcriptional regulator [uncultured Dubosiella sp.]GJM56400.1 hypothetical protein EROP_00930 [Erysipelotrichaceae bacterium OPF54]